MHRYNTYVERFSSNDVDRFCNRVGVTQVYHMNIEVFLSKSEHSKLIRCNITGLSSVLIVPRVLVITQYHPLQFLVGPTGKFVMEAVAVLGIAVEVNDA